MSRRPYLRKVRRTWWLRRRRYFAYMVREMTSLFIGIYSAVLVMGLISLAQGQSAWEHFIAILSSRPGVLLQLVCLVFATYHSVTWFAVTPKAMSLMVRGQPVSAKTIIRMHYAAWIAVSLVVLIAAGV
jgi:succinate dehydrogenase subunit C